MLTRNTLCLAPTLTKIIMSILNEHISTLWMALADSDILFFEADYYRVARRSQDNFLHRVQSNLYSSAAAS